MKNSTYIFEGKVIDFSFYKGEDQKIRVSYLIKVENVLKNNNDFFALDTIELVSFAPENWDVSDRNELIRLSRNDIDELCKGLDLEFDRTGIFFGKPKGSDFTVVHKSIFFQLTPYSESCKAYFSIPPYFHNCSESKNDFVFQGFDKRFEFLSDFNDYLRKNNLSTLSIKKRWEHNFTPKKEDDRPDYKNGE